MAILACIVLTQTFGQSQRKVNTYFFVQGNKTVYDRTITNNSVGFGLGLQAFLNNKSKFKPTIEVNNNIFGGTKELYLTTDGKPIYGKSEVTNIFFGYTFSLADNFYVGFILGPSFIDSDPYLGIKPKVGFYFSEKKRISGTLSLTSIFQRDNISNKSFGYFSLGMGFKLF
ncbi:MAG: hypothetical protein ABJA71_14995 [Ginsengibacter sp.]